jgi:hypothetical protein
MKNALHERLVDLVRFELTTSSMPWKRAPNCATGPQGVGKNARNAIRQLSRRRVVSSP